MTTAPTAARTTALVVSIRFSRSDSESFRSRTASRRKGRLKEAWGGLTSNKRMKDKGRADTATETAKKKSGGAADKVKDRLD